MTMSVTCYRSCACFSIGKCEVMRGAFAAGVLLDQFGGIMVPASNG